MSILLTLATGGVRHGARGVGQLIRFCANWRRSKPELGGRRADVCMDEAGACAFGIVEDAALLLGRRAFRNTELGGNLGGLNGRRRNLV